MGRLTRCLSLSLPLVLCATWPAQSQTAIGLAPRAGGAQAGGAAGSSWRPERLDPASVSAPLEPALGPGVRLAGGISPTIEGLTPIESAVEAAGAAMALPELPVSAIPLALDAPQMHAGKSDSGRTRPIDALKRTVASIENGADAQGKLERLYGLGDRADSSFEEPPKAAPIQNKALIPDSGTGLRRPVELRLEGKGLAIQILEGGQKGIASSAAYFRRNRGEDDLLESTLDLLNSAIKIAPRMWGNDKKTAYIAAKKSFARLLLNDPELRWESLEKGILSWHEPRLWLQSVIPPSAAMRVFFAMLLPVLMAWWTATQSIRLVHELGHYAAARSLGAEVLRFRVFPSGAGGLVTHSPVAPAKDALIALAGPLLQMAAGGFLFYLAASSGSGLRIKLLEAVPGLIGILCSIIESGSDWSDALSLIRDPERRP